MNLFAHLLGSGGLHNFDNQGELPGAVPRAGAAPPGFMGQPLNGGMGQPGGFDAPRMPGP